MPRYSDSDYVNLSKDFLINYSETPITNKFNLHVHDAYEITLILSDDVEVFANDVSYPVPRGSLLLFNTMDSHKIKYRGSDTYRRFVILFKPDFISELDTLTPKLLRCFFLRNFEKSNLLCLSEDQLSETLGYYKRLEQLSGTEFMKKERLMLALSEFLIFVNDIYFTKNMHNLPTHYDDYGAVYKAILHIQENFSKDISRKTLATLTGTSERTLCEFFKNVTGLTTNQYILTYRLSAAKNLLLKGMQTTAVAEKTGFDNYSNFSRTFKKHVGVSPKQYAMHFSNNSTLS